jgi:hypothetical protein
VFRDRDLALLGAGALLSALCLLLPLAFGGKLIAGAAMLVGFIVLALLRLGPDRVPLEVWLLRRLRFWLSPRRFVYHRPGWKLPPRRVKAPRRVGVLAARGLRQSRKLHLPPLQATPARVRPIALVLPESGVYPLVTVMLAVLGVYFVAWLAQGGAQEIAAVFH